MLVTDLFLTKPQPAGRQRARRRDAGPQVLRIEVLEDRCLWSYSITDLGTLGGTQSFAYGINNRGWVSGTSAVECNCTTRPFLWAGDALHDLGTGAAGGGINDLGQVVGRSNGHPFLWSRESGLLEFGVDGGAGAINNRTEVIGGMGAPVQHAFLWKDGRILDLGTLGGAGSGAIGLNDAGQVVGQASGPPGQAPHAFVWSRSEGMRDLGSLDGDPGSTSAAWGINDAGQIVGNSYSRFLGSTHATYFSQSAGNIDLGTLGGSLSTANAVNNAGQVVGCSSISGMNHAFVTDLATMHMVDLNTQIPSGSGWLLFDATALNDAGQIAGDGDINGEIHAYLLTPDDSPWTALVPVACVRAQPVAPPVNMPVGNNERLDLALSPAMVDTGGGSGTPTEGSPIPRPLASLGWLANVDAVTLPWGETPENPLEC